MNWEYVLYSSTMVLALALMIYGVFIYQNVKMMKKSRTTWVKIQDSVEVGKKVLVNGMVGTVKAIDEEYLSVELAPNVVVKAAKYTVSKVFD